MKISFVDSLSEKSDERTERKILRFVGIFCLIGLLFVVDETDVEFVSFIFIENVDRVEEEDAEEEEEEDLVRVKCSAVKNIDKQN